MKRSVFLLALGLLGTRALLVAQAPPVSIVLFTDAQSPDCLAARNTLAELQAAHGGSVSVLAKSLRASGPDYLPQHASEARALGVETLPTLFVNGRRLAGPVDRRALERVIDLSTGKLLAAEATPLPLKAAPRLGKPGLPEITVFSDFQCPYCATVAPVLKELAASGEAAIRFKPFPLSFHAKAPAAHKAAWAAGQQGKFWEMHDRIFAAPGMLDSATFERYARELELDIPRYQQDIASPAATAQLQADLADGERIPIEGTPTLFINGHQYLGRPSIENFRLALKSLGTAAPLPAGEPPVLRLTGAAADITTLEWFFDAHSPLTASSVSALRDLLARKPKGLQIVVRHLPQPFHPEATFSHQALAIAAQQERFWPMFDLILRETAPPERERLKSLALRAGLDLTRFADQLDRGAAASVVERDQLRAKTLNVRGVPTFVLNGKAIDGLPSLDVLTALIDAAQRGIQVAHAGDKTKQ